MNGPYQSDHWAELSGVVVVVVVGILEAAAGAGVALREGGVVNCVDVGVEDVAKDELADDG